MSSRLRRLALALSGLLVAAAAAKAEPDDVILAERGRYLATAGDCIACHTAPGQPPFSGGRPLLTPFGIINSANITPDNDTGLGRWSADDFYHALHTGRGRDESFLYPAFPYPYYTKVTRADSDAIFAYLRKLPPASHAVNRDTLPFPFSIRTSLGAWNALFFTPGEFRPDARRSAEFNRGAYLVEGLGHCGACHTPMNFLGAGKSGAALEGNVIQGWMAPNLTNDRRTGLGDWSVDDVVTYLRTGRNERSAATGPMAEVVMNSTASMNDGDLRAIAVYLKEREAAPVAPAPAPLSTGNPQMQAGAAIYADTCAACHVRNGEGIAQLFPRLAGNPAVQQAEAASLIRVVAQGTKAAVTARAPTGPAMPSLGWRLSNDEIAAVVTYIRNSWGNAAPAVSADDVARLRKTW